MMNLDLQGLKEWFDLNAEKNTKGNKSFWALKGDDGRRFRNIFTNTVIGDRDESWAALVKMIENQSRNGIRKFEITYKTSPSDPAGISFFLEVPWNHNFPAGQIQQGAAGIHGLDHAPATTGFQERLFEQRLTAIQESHAREMEMLKKDIAHQRKVEELESRIEGIQNESISAIDRLIERIDESPLLSSIARSMFPQIAIQGPRELMEVPPQSVPGPPTEVPEKREQNDAPNSIDFNPGIGLTMALLHAGHTDPAGAVEQLTSHLIPFLGAGFDLSTLFQVLNWAATNPDQAQMILSQLPQSNEAKESIDPV